MKKRHEDMMIFQVEKRWRYFRESYTIELGRAHAAGNYEWDIGKLPQIVERVMKDISEMRVPSGRAMVATKKFFEIETNKELFAFLGISKNPA